MIAPYLKCSTCGHVVPMNDGHRYHEKCTASVLGVYEDYTPVADDASITPGMFATSEDLRCDDEAAP